jgi:hypothetical protein
MLGVPLHHVARARDPQPLCRDDVGRAAGAVRARGRRVRPSAAIRRRGQTCGMVYLCVCIPACSALLVELRAVLCFVHLWIPLGAFQFLKYLHVSLLPVSPSLCILPPQASECEYRPAVCKYEPLGCTWAGVVKDVKAHRKECEVKAMSAKELLVLVKKRDEVEVCARHAVGQQGLEFRFSHRVFYSSHRMLFCAH